MTARPRPLVDYYRAHRANVVGVHADRPVEAVFAEIEHALGRGDGARMIIRKSAAEIEGMARAGELVYETLQLVAEHLDPGVTMLELDRIAEEYIRSHGGVPTSKGYKGFPAAICISPNSMVVHGIPTEYQAQEGDLISVDLGVTLGGLVADSAVTFGVGEIAPEAQRLLDVCQEALGGRDRAGAGREPPLGHLPRRSGRGRGGAGSRSSAASSGTGSGGRSTRIPRSRTTGRPGAARCSRRG